MTAIRIDELTYPALEKILDSGIDTLLLPVGTLEAHGRHAPIGTDNFCAEDIALKLGERTGWPVAPTLNYGVTTGLVAYPGGIRIPKGQYAELMETILTGFLEMGFRRVVIINGHGGNTESLGLVVKNLIVSDPGRRHFIVIDWWHFDPELLEEIYGEGRKGGHAALDETACIAAFRPELLDETAVNSDEFTRFTSGLISAPYSSAVLVYEDGDSTPDFSHDKAVTFIEKLLDKLETAIRREVELFNKSFGSG